MLVGVQPPRGHVHLSAATAGTRHQHAAAEIHLGEEDIAAGGEAELRRHAGGPIHRAGEGEAGGGFVPAKLVLVVSAVPPAWICAPLSQDIAAGLKNTADGSCTDAVPAPAIPRTA